MKIREKIKQQLQQEYELTGNSDILILIGRM